MQLNSSRLRALAVLLSVCVAASIACLAATSLIRSPQQEAAEAEPPPKTELTAAVDKRELRQTIVLRGRVKAGRSNEIEAPPPGPAGEPVITDMGVGVGDEVQAGAVLAEVAGRPLIVLPGEFPMYRHLRPGMQGKDVVQLQEALIMLGFILPEPNGVYGPTTQQAVSELYESRGYEPMEAEAGVSSDGEQNPSGGESPADEASVPDSGVDGPMVPRGELAFLSSLPAAVDDVHGDVGQTVDGPLLKVTSGNLKVITSVSDSERSLIEVGDSVEIYSEAHDIEVDAELDKITPPDSSAPEDQAVQRNQEEAGSPAEGHRVEVTGDFAEQLAEADVRVTVETASTESEVLAVPTAAVFSRHDGTTYVITSDDVEREVRTGTSAGGWVEIRGEGVHEGDTVVVSAE